MASITSREAPAAAAALDAESGSGAAMVEERQRAARPKVLTLKCILKIFWKQMKNLGARWEKKLECSDEDGWELSLAL